MTTRADLLFVAEMAARYHRRRATFLDRANLFLTLMTLVAGGGAFLSLFGDSTTYAKVAALAVTIIGVIQIVYRPEACAGYHREWLGRWLRILREIRTEEKPSPQQIADWIERRYALEAECVGEMRALQVDCYNRTMRALNREGAPKRLRWWHRTFMQLLSFEHAFEKAK